MVLRDDTIGQKMLIPTDLRKIIPKDHPCYLVENIVDRISFDEIDNQYRYTAGARAYSRKMLLRLVLMATFDGGLSGREIEGKTHTDLSYMYLAGMQKPDFRTINRFKKDNKELIDKAFETTILVAEKKDLIKIKHIAIDGTKIKAKTSINILTDKKQLELLRKIIEKSIELDEDENEQLTDESGNKVPLDLTDKETFDKIYDMVKKESEGDRNQDKLRLSSKRLIKQASKNPESAQKVLKKINHIDEELDKTQKSVISVNDPESRWMLNKKGKWEFDYNYQIAVDDYKGFILSAEVYQNPTDHKMLIPTIENVEHIFGPLHPGTQISADNGYSTDENAEYLEHKQLDGYISTRKLSRILKKYNIKQNPYSKDNFTYNHEKDGYICPLGQIMNLKGTYKNKKNSHKTVYWTKKCHDCQVKEICATKNQYRTITDYGNPAKIRMHHKMDEKWAQEIYAQRSKTVEWPFGHLKRNIKMIEFNYTGVEMVNTEMKLHAIGHNLKRLYNELNKTTKNQENT